MSLEYETNDGPAIMEGLRRSRDAWKRGDREESRRIVDQLMTDHGPVCVSAVVGAVRLGFVSLDLAPED